MGMSVSRRDLLGAAAAGVAAGTLPTPATAETSHVDDRMRSDRAWERFLAGQLRLTDWKSGPAFAETEAIRTTRYHTRAGARDVKVAIFHQVVALDPTRELRSITLPAATAPRPHLFAISLERPT
ncbi:MAG TPA: twin-arginine translocation signal domain-containing protein [Actinophytocola sp.]|uniref:twin-arginine translocation signal domain-containing protein n=1 Tax=Actinophytocola sp. TaxID=1872138 RepID=UPI002DDCFE79|nr:twin-arginine translocation signal domain-containing protein [Actinophytocola sp.]HEV2781596.1 twin-arginine translocation signal domain-containing protein [Actinophytocola sp.]